MHIYSLSTLFTLLLSFFNTVRKAGSMIYQSLSLGTFSVLIYDINLLYRGVPIKQVSVEQGSTVCI